MLTSCGQSDEPQQSAADNGVTVTNCGKGVTYAQADNLFVNDANIISMVLSVGAAEDVVEGSPSFEGGRGLILTSLVRLAGRKARRSGQSAHGLRF